MPCEDRPAWGFEPREDGIRRDANKPFIKDVEELKNTIANLKEKNNFLARINCKLLKTLNNLIDDPEIKDWWEDHKKFDAARL